MAHLLETSGHRTLRGSSHPGQLSSQPYQRRPDCPGWTHCHLLRDRDHHSGRQEPLQPLLPTRTRLTGMDSTHARNGGDHQAPSVESARHTAQLTITATPEGDPGPDAPRTPQPHPQRTSPRDRPREASSCPTLAQAYDTCTRRYHVLRSTRRPTTLEEHRSHS